MGTFEKALCGDGGSVGACPLRPVYGSVHFVSTGGWQKGNGCPEARKIPLHAFAISFDKSSMEGESGGYRRD